MPKSPTIYEVLRTKLGREPTHAELCADVRRILAEAADDRAQLGGGGRSRTSAVERAGKV